MDKVKNPHIHGIALTLTSLASGGAEKQCLLLASLLQHYYQVILIVIDPQPQHHQHLEFITQHKLEVVFLRGNWLNKILQLKRLLLQKEIDLILSYLPKDIIMTSLALGSRKVHHFGGIRNARMNKIKLQILRHFHNQRLRGSISNCHSGKLFFVSRGFNSEKIKVIPNGIKIDVAAIRRVATPQIIITTLGRLVAQKDYITAIKSMAYLKSNLAENTPFHYNIVGSGDEESTLRSLLKETGLVNEVTILTNAKDISKILRQTDIYLSTSLFEGVSNAIMEAMLYSLPVVATDAGDNKILVAHELSGYIVNQQDAEGIGGALLKLVRSDEERQKMGAYGYQRLQEEFNLEIFLARYLQHLNSLK